MILERHRYVLAMGLAVLAHYVPQAALGGATLTVPTEFPTIGAALAAAVSGDEVLVLPGTYPADGNTELNFAGRDIVVRSSNGSTETVIDTLARRVVTFSSAETGAARFEGFTLLRVDNPNGISITNGSPTISDIVTVSGMFSNGAPPIAVSGNTSRPLFLDCVFRNARMTNALVAPLVQVSIGAIPRFDACSFEAGWAQNNAGAVYVNGTSANFVRCSFLDNRGPQAGAVHHSGNGIVRFVSCTLLRNQSEQNGGGVTTTGGTLELSNCVLAENTANQSGGAIYAGATTKIGNCTFSQNACLVGGGALYAANPTYFYDVANSIMWQNFPDEYAGVAIPSIRYSCVEDGAIGPGNISSDPMFQAIPSEDFRVDSLSPCIDSGSVPLIPADSLDVDGDGDLVEPLPYDRVGDERRMEVGGAPDCWQAPGTCGESPVVDMGACEFAEGNECPRLEDGDLNGDGTIDMADFAIFQLHFGESCP